MMSIMMKILMIILLCSFKITRYTDRETWIHISKNVVTNQPFSRPLSILASSFSV